MITSTTPHKLADIIRDTWPGLYRPTQMHYNRVNTQETNAEHQLVQRSD